MEQKEYKQRPLDTQLGTPEFEARFKRLWKQYRDWFNTEGIMVDASRGNYRDSKIGISLGMQCGDSDEKILEKWILISSLNQYFHRSFCC